MRIPKWLAAIFGAGLGLALGLAAVQAGAQTPVQTIDLPQGGHIVYGPVDGATDQGSAMKTLLRVMHQNCGERPKIGQVFKLNGSDAVGVYFTVTNHAAGNVPVAGVIIAAGSGHGRQEAALMSDQSSRFNSSFRPMLTKLFAVWHAGGLPPAAPAPANSTSAPASNRVSGSAPVSASASGSGPAARLHIVSNNDNSASIGIPDGWSVDPSSRVGSIAVQGPNGEVVAMNLVKQAVDPTNPYEARAPRGGLKMVQGELVYPFHGDLQQTFPGIFQAWRRAAGKGPAQLKVEKIESIQSDQGGHCVQVRGQMDPDGHGMQAMDSMMCAIDQNSIGAYLVTMNHSLLPLGVADKEHATMTAIMKSFQINQQVYQQQIAAMLSRQQANTQASLAQSQREIEHIHAIGAAATNRINAAHALEDQQHADYYARHDKNDQVNQGFSNYLRDQTVVRDNENPNEHVTVWNTTANWLQQTFPGRVEEVPTSQYIKGQDF